MFQKGDKIKVVSGEHAGKSGVINQVIENPATWDLDLFEEPEAKPFAKVTLTYYPWGIEVAEPKALDTEIYLDNLEADVTK